MSLEAEQEMWGAIASQPAPAVSVVDEQRARRAFGQLQREKVAWRFGYADALLGHAPAVDVWPGVGPEYRSAYLEGRASAVEAGRFGSASEHRPSLALRAAILREELAG